MGGQVTGRAMVRPVRLGMIFEPSLAVLRLATEHATLLWGGIYQPFLDPADTERLRWEATRLGVDVLWAVDNSATSAEAAKLTGFQWHGHGEWSPLAPAKDYTSPRLLGPEFLLDSAGHDAWALPHWAADDPLSNMFSVWFGMHGASEQGVNLESWFAARSGDIRFDHGAALPADVTSWVTPIAATATSIEYTGLPDHPGFMVIDPASAADLMTFWNLRAHGANVFPWPGAYEGRVLAAARAWLQQLLDNGELRRWISGDGKPLGPRIWVWLPTGSGQPPDALAELIADAGVGPMPSPPDGAFGWKGDHPFTTSFSHPFSQPLHDNGRTVGIPVPRIGGSAELRRQPHGDVIAMQVEITSAVSIKPDWTFAVPNVRSLAPFLAEYDGVLLHFDRPTADGRALSAPSGAQAVSISAVPSVAIFGKLTEESGWSARQTPGGVFVARLIERLGGPSSTIANEPGARAGLLEAARSQQGRPSAAIIQRIRQHQGAWPDTFASEQSKADYAGGVFRYLLAQGILRPVLPVACPHCTTSNAVRPEDLTTQMKCEMCLQEFPLGLALGLSPNGRNDWHYQLAGHVSEDRLREALPVMAALQVLTAFRYLSPPGVPHVLGWKVQGPDVDCEIDVAAILDERGQPVVVIGEVKHHLKSVDANDLRNLGLIQRHFRERGIECFILAGVLRDLRPEEIAALREFAHRPPRTLPARSSIEPVLPIVLTERDLSVPRFGEHPLQWAAGDGVIGLARESCRRNLGMTGMEDAIDSDGFYFKPKWS